MHACMHGMPMTVCVHTCNHMTTFVLREDREAPSHIHLHARDAFSHIPQCVRLSSVWRACFLIVVESDETDAFWIFFWCTQLHQALIHFFDTEAREP